MQPDKGKECECPSCVNEKKVAILAHLQLKHDSKMCCEMADAPRNGNNCYFFFNYLQDKMILIINVRQQNRKCNTMNEVIDYSVTFANLHQVVVEFWDEPS